MSARVRFVLLCALLVGMWLPVLAGAAVRDPALVPNPDCGGEGELPCSADDDEYGFYRTYWEHVSFQKSHGCDIGLIRNIANDQCINATTTIFPAVDGRQTTAPEDFAGTWTAWALGQQELLAYDEPFNWVSRIGTHNSYNSRNGGSPGLIESVVGPNQIYSITDQLRFGVRKIELDLHWVESSLRVCHGKGTADNHQGCTTLSRPFFSVMKEIRDWLDQPINANAFLFIEMLDEWENHDDNVIWPIEYYLGDRVLRTTDIDGDPSTTDVEDFWTTKNRAPSKRETDRLLTFPKAKQVMFLGNTGVSDLGSLLWPGTRISGDAVNFTFEEDDNSFPYGVCRSGTDDLTPITDSDATVASAKFRRTYEARSRFDITVDAVGYLNREQTHQNQSLQRLVQDVVRCNLTPTFDFIQAQEDTPVLFPNSASLDQCNGGADCSEPDNRLKAAVWSWKEDDEGTGNLGLFDPEDGRWTSRTDQDAEQHHFACARARHSLVDPSEWNDAPGAEWKITKAIGEWVQGMEICLQEFGQPPQSGTAAGDYFPFSVPVNGWQNERLKHVWQQAMEDSTFPNKDKKVWLNFRQNNLGEWIKGDPPFAKIKQIDLWVDKPGESMKPISKEEIREGDLIRYGVSSILNPLDIPLIKTLEWKLSPGFHTNFLGEGTTFELGIGFMRSIDFSHPTRAGINQWTLEVVLHGDLSGFPEGLGVTDALLDYHNIQFSLQNAPPVILGPSGFYREEGDLFADRFNTSFSIQDPGGLSDKPFTCTIDYGNGDPVVTVTGFSDSSNTGHRCFHEDDPALQGPTAATNRLGATYPEGAFVVTITVTDKDGGSSVHTFPVVNEGEVTPVPAPPTFGGRCANQSIAFGDAMNCVQYFEDPNANDSFDAQIQYGDDTSETLIIWNQESNPHYVIPYHEYAKSGTYDVILTLMDGPTEPFHQIQKFWTVTVGPEPDEPFEEAPAIFGGPAGGEPGPVFSKVTGKEGETVSKQVVIVDPNPASAKWTVYLNWDQAVESSRTLRSYTVTRPAGSVAPAPVPFTITYTYNTPGTFAVSMSAKETTTGVTNDNPFSAIRYFSAVIASDNVPPDLGGVSSDPVVLNAGGILDLPNQTFTDPDETDVFLGTVNWGDGTTGILTIVNNTFRLMHEYRDSSPEPYLVTVSINDGTETIQTTFSVTVKNVAPTGIATNSGPVPEGSPATVTVNNQVDSPGDTAAGFSYHYDFDNNGTFEVQDSAAALATVPASFLDNGPGSFPVRVRLADQHGGFTDLSTTIQVTNVAPTGMLVSSGQVLEGGAASVSVINPIDPSTGDTLAGFTYSYDFGGNGTFEVVDNPLSYAPVPLTLLADGPVAIPVHVRIADRDADFTELKTNIAVQNVAPTVEAGANQTVVRNQILNVLGTWTDPAGALDDSYVWQWRLDANPAPVAQASASYGTTAPYSTSFSTLGMRILAFDVTDADGGQGSDSLTVNVVNQAPVCAATTPSVTTLWPANKKFHTVEILGVTDPDEDPFTLTVTSVFQDESVPSNKPDATGIGQASIQLRAQREGSGDGRVYHVRFTADDGLEGTCSGEVLVNVPHNQGAPAIDGGPIFDSTGS